MVALSNVRKCSGSFCLVRLNAKPFGCLARIYPSDDTLALVNVLSIEELFLCR